MKRLNLKKMGIPLPPSTPTVNSFTPMLGCTCDNCISLANGAAFIAAPLKNRVCYVTPLSLLLWRARFMCVPLRVLWSPRHKKRAPIFSVPSPEPLIERSAVGAQLPDQLCMRVPRDVGPLSSTFSAGASETGTVEPFRSRQVTQQTVP